MPHRAVGCRDRTGHEQDGKRPLGVRGIDVRRAPIMDNRSVWRGPQAGRLRTRRGVGAEWARYAETEMVQCKSTAPYGLLRMRQGGGLR